MTEKSLFWYTDGFTGDIGDGAAPYTQEEFREFNAAWATGKAANQGVLYGVDGGLAVSGSSSPLSVATGWSFVNGFPHFIKTAASSLVVSTPSVGDTGGRVVLRANFTAATVRSTIILSADGNSAIPALTQSAGTVWDIPLATFVIDTSGNIWTDSGKSVAGVTDVIEYAKTPLATVPRTRRFMVRPASAYNFTDALEITYGNNPYLILPDGKTSIVKTIVPVPNDYAGDLVVYALLAPGLTGTQHVSFGLTTKVLSVGDGLVLPALVTVDTEFNTISSSELTLVEANSYSGTPAAGDFVVLHSGRSGADGADTMTANLILFGFIIEYTADS